MLFRFPGGKRALVKELTGFLVQIYSQHPFTEYREPFMGGGAVCFQLLRRLPTAIRKVWINDLDRGVYAIWWATINCPTEFKRLIQDFNPSIKHFYAFQKELLDENRLATMDILELALKKLAVHQMSYSGLGTMAGGPIGGKTQRSSRYTVECRWSPRNIFRGMDNVNRLLTGKKVEITSIDYREALRDAGPETAVYLDPPYFEKGPELYQFSFNAEQHRELAQLLRTAKFQWLLSYDDHPEITGLYQELAHIERVPIAYTINGIAKTFELVIVPKTLRAAAQSQLQSF